MNVGDPGPLTANLDAALSLMARKPFAYDALREVNGWASGYFRTEDYMPRMSVEQRTELSADVAPVLAPELQTQLEANLSTYQELKMQLALITDAMETEKHLLRALMEDNGVESTTVGGCTLRMVRGTTNSVDWKRLHADGIISEAQRENYTVTRPKKSYLDIRGADDND